jgi:hypothetical protein
MPVFSRGWNTLLCAPWFFTDDLADKSLVTISVDDPCAEFQFLTNRVSAIHDGIWLYGAKQDLFN